MSLHDKWRGDVMPQSGVKISIGRNNFDPPAPVVPVVDIHHRSTITHDVSQSGIVSYDSLLRRLGLIPNHSGVQTIVPGDIICVHMVSGDTTIDTGTLTPVPFNTVRTNTNSNLYELKGVSGIIQVHASGIYDIEYRGSAANNNGITQRVTRRFWLQKLSPSNNESAFFEIPGTRGYVYLHNTVPGDDTALARCIIPLQAEDMIMVAVNAFGGSSIAGISVIGSGCGLTIERLE